MPSKTLSLRLPVEDIDKLEQLAERQGSTATDLLKDAVRRLLGHEIDPTTNALTKRPGSSPSDKPIPASQIVGTTKGASKHAREPMKAVKPRTLIGFDPQTGEALYR